LNLNADELLGEPFAFVDREGDYVAPWPVTLKIVQRIAARYPEKTLAHMHQEERKLQDEAVRGASFERGRGEVPGYLSPEQCAEYLRKRQPVFDLVRSWCGADSVSEFDALAELRSEVNRLRELVDDAASVLVRNNLKSDARRLRSTLTSTS
jgi:hypothetical protein